MEEAEYAHDMGVIKLREPIQIWFTSKYDSVPLTELSVGSETMSQYGEEAGLNDRVLDSLTEHGVETVGQLMDLFVAGESRMIKDIAGFGAAAMDDTRRLCASSACWARRGRKTG